MATNHITGTGLHTDLLEALTDEQLEEQIAYYRQEREQATEGRDSYEWSKLLSTATTVQSERSHEND